MPGYLKLKSSKLSTKPKITKVFSKRQKQRKREWMKFYNKLSMYGQEPPSILESVSSRDINRIKSRWDTVHEYEKIYRRFERSVKGFNEKYMQNVKLIEPHNRIDTRTLSNLKKQYDLWKKERAKFVRKIGKENEKMVDNLRDILKDAREFLTPDKWTGTYSANDERIAGNISGVGSMLDVFLPEKGPERKQALLDIKNNWDEIVECINILIYDSDQERRRQAYIKLMFLLTGNGWSDDLDDTPFEDMVYE